MKTTFILKNGHRVIVNRFMEGPTLTKGYWWWNVGHRTWFEVKA